MPQNRAKKGKTAAKKRVLAAVISVPQLIERQPSTEDSDATEAELSNAAIESSWRSTFRSDPPRSEATPCCHCVGAGTPTSCTVRAHLAAGFRDDVVNEEAEERQMALDRREAALCRHKRELDRRERVLNARERCLAALRNPDSPESRAKRRVEALARSWLRGTW